MATFKKTDGEDVITKCACYTQMMSSWTAGVPPLAWKMLLIKKWPGNYHIGHNHTVNFPCFLSFCECDRVVCPLNGIVLHGQHILAKDPLRVWKSNRYLQKELWGIRRERSSPGNDWCLGTDPITVSLRAQSKESCREGKAGFRVLSSSAKGKFLVIIAASGFWPVQLELQTFPLSLLTGVWTASMSRQWFVWISFAFTNCLTETLCKLFSLWISAGFVRLLSVGCVCVCWDRLQSRSQGICPVSLAGWAYTIWLNFASLEQQKAVRAYLTLALDLDFSISYKTSKPHSWKWDLPVRSSRWARRCSSDWNILGGVFLPIPFSSEL